MHDKVQKLKSFRIKVLGPSIHKNMIQILNHNLEIFNSYRNFCQPLHFTARKKVGMKINN